MARERRKRNEQTDIFTIIYGAADVWVAAHNDGDGDE